MKPWMFLLFALFLFSFENEREVPADLLGYWVLDNYEVETAVYRRQLAFDKDKPGICFQKNGKLLKRQNSGWCGTPPITYTNNEGSWEQKSDSTITIRYKYWGGMAEEEWLISSLQKNTLKIKTLSYKNDRDKEWQLKEPH